MSPTHRYDELFSISDQEDIFDRAIRVLLRKGLLEVSIADVAELLGADKDLLEEAFPTEHDLLVAALQWYYLKYSRQMRSVMALHSDIYSALYNVLVEFTELCWDQTEAERGLFWPTIVDLGYVDQALAQEFEKLQFDWEDQIRDKLEQCKAELSKPEDIDTLTCYFVMMFEGIYELVKFKTPKERLYRVIDMSLETLQSRMKRHPLERD